MVLSFSVFSSHVGTKEIKYGTVGGIKGRICQKRPENRPSEGDFSYVEVATKASSATILGYDQGSRYLGFFSGTIFKCGKVQELFDKYKPCSRPKIVPELA